MYTIGTKAVESEIIRVIVLKNVFFLFLQLLSQLDQYILG